MEIYRGNRRPVGSVGGLKMKVYRRLMGAAGEGVRKNGSL